MRISIPAKEQLKSYHDFFFCFSVVKTEKKMKEVYLLFYNIYLIFTYNPKVDQIYEQTVINRTIVLYK